MLLTLLCMLCCAFKFVGTIDSWHGVHASNRLVYTICPAACLACWLSSEQLQLLKNESRQILS